MTDSRSARRDGWVSIKPTPGSASGTLTTRTLNTTGTTLWVNMDAIAGSVTVEVLSAGAQVLAHSVRMSGDYPQRAVQWEHGAVPADVPIALRFTLQGEVHLYSYWTTTSTASTGINGVAA
jgi:hypothetical protein